MRKFSTLMLGLMVAGSLFAQRPEGVIVKATTQPVIDGVIDDVWAGANEYNIDRNFQQELPTLGNAGETTWKMLWDEAGLYVMLNVADDAYLPSYAVSPAGNSWDYDKPELYFDVNYVLEDGYGPGHYQIAPEFVADKIDGTPSTESNGVVWAVKVNGTNYVVEYFIPIGMLQDKAGVGVDLAGTVGFDVTFIDRDPGDAARKRAVWANDGTTGAMSETNGNMDVSGKITFEGFELNYIESIALTAGSITKDNEKLQMVASVLPENATFKDLKWSVTTKEGSTGRALIDSKGVLTPISDGVVTVTAAAIDGSNADVSVDVTISGQVVTFQEISIIKNGNFDQGTDGKKDWIVSGSVQEGWLVTECTLRGSPWDHKILQKVKIKDAETKYIVKFKAYASVDMVTPLVQEDENNGWNKDMASTSPYRASDNWLIPVTTEPQWFEIDMIHLAWSENSNFNFNWQLGKIEGTLYVDSVMIYDEADLSIVTGARTLSNVNKVKLYPNPVQTELTISKIAVANSKVSVYNALGQKLMEKTANGTQAKFDVANLRKGMYFVRFSDGSSQKFIKE